MSPRRPPKQQQGAEGEDVGADDPRQHRRCDAEVALDAGQRDVGDGVVEDEHQLGGSYDQER
jgi:hypothetical protein